MTPYDLAYEYALHTNRSIYLTGKAGTGKTTFLKRLTRECPKQIMVVAPTGVAAINAEGTTIHSLFQLPPQLFIPTEASYKALFREMQMRAAKLRLLRNLEMLVIDEVSMVRADLLDAIDAVLRHVRHRRDLPFGGVQVLLIGDLYQLSPVARDHEWSLLRPYYVGPYFFQSRVFQQIQPVYVELDKVYRQQNQLFVEILNEVRSNTLTPEHLDMLNARFQPDFLETHKQEAAEYITLSTHNKKVDAINQRELDDLPGRAYTYRAKVEGQFPESLYPMDTTLTLKQGARVMFLRADSSQEKAYYNGKLGVVTELSSDHIVVESEGEQIEVHPEEWPNIRYNSKPGSDEIEPETIGTFTHYPLRLAWAVTVHKAQGLTFDKVVIDVADAFAAGQVYVALSRCRSLEGIVLLSRIARGSLTNARDVTSFTQSQASVEQMSMALELSQRVYFCRLLQDLYDMRSELTLIESMERLVADSTSFNREVTNDFLLNLRNQLLQLQTTADAFQVQLNNIFAATELDWTFLQKRLQAAAEYFVPLLHTLTQKVEESPAFADDKQDAREYEEQIKDLYVGLCRRQYLMVQMGKKPSIKAYFDARSSFSVPRKHISASAENSQAESQHPVLLKRLFALRREIAEEYGYDTIYQVASAQNLIDISNVLPTTKRQLMAIKGIGAKRYQLIGEAVLQLVSRYKEQQKK